MISSKAPASDLSDQPESALSELGPLLAMTQSIVKHELDARRVYFGRYGHSSGYPIHFHVIPIYEWVEEMFWADDRYRLLENFAEGPGETPTDGAELTLFVWREFCERTEPPSTKGPSVTQDRAIAKCNVACNEVKRVGLLFGSECFYTASRISRCR